MADLLGGLLAPYSGSPAPMDTTSPLLQLALSVAMGQGGGSPAMGSPSGGGNPGGGMGPAPAGGSLADWINRAEQATGVGSDWTKGLNILIQHESGGNPGIVNQTPTPLGRHAEGLAQMIPPTFDAYNIPGLGGIFNPVANLAAAIKYIQDRYGSVYNTPGVSSVMQGGSYHGY